MLAPKRVSCSSKAKLPNGDNLNHRLEKRSSIEVALAKQGSMKFPFHYSLHIYVASFPLTSTLDLFSIFLDKKLLHMPFFAMGIMGSKINWLCNVCVYATHNGLSNSHVAKLHHNLLIP